MGSTLVHFKKYWLLSFRVIYGGLVHCALGPLYNFETYKWLFSFAKCRDNQHEKLAYFLVVGDKWLNLTTACTMGIFFLLSNFPFFIFKFF